MSVAKDSENYEIDWVLSGNIHIGRGVVLGYFIFRFKF